MAQGRPRARTIEERVGVRWPNLLRRMTRLVLRMRPGSRVRRAMLRRIAKIVFGAWHRSDFALVPLVDDPEVETHVALGSAPPIGLDPVYYGPEGHCRAMEVWNEAWAEWDADIVDVIEEGRDRVLVVGRIHAVGATSGVVLDEWGAVRYTFRDGLIVRVDGIFDPDREMLLDVAGEHGSTSRGH